MAMFKKGKKKGKKKAAAPAPQPVANPEPPPPPPTTDIYYRACSGAPPALYRVSTMKPVKAAGGGLDLTDVPPGKVTRWDRQKDAWVPSRLPPVGADSHCVRHTKNKAGTGV